MAALAFDTHALVKELTAAGFTEPQAEAVTSVVRRTRAAELDELARRADLENATAQLRSDTAQLQSDLERGTALLRNDRENATTLLKSDLGNATALYKSELENATARLERDLENATALLKSELDNTTALLKSELARTATKTDVAEAKNDVLKWVIGAIGFQAVVILGGVLAIAKLHV